MEQILHAPEEDQMAALYTAIQRDPRFLHAYDGDYFMETPLHEAARYGRTLLVLEIQRLVPSLGRKLNPSGFSPLDLALQKGHRDTVVAMVSSNPDLVRVQGREGITPLHCAAEMNEADLLAEFLFHCPGSIDDKTVRGESALHLAVKHQNVAAFTVLHEWLEKTRTLDVYGWKDGEGNTVLHLAASTNQVEVIKLLLTTNVPVNAKNKEGFTALDLANLQAQVDGRALKMLKHRGAKSGSSSTSPNYLRSSTAGEKGMIFDAATFLDSSLPRQVRNTIMVVAAFILSATYQVVLRMLMNTGKTMMPEKDLYFMPLNSIAFATSLGVLLMLLPLRWYSFILHLSLVFMGLSYVWAIKSISPLEGGFIGFAASVVFVCLLAAKMLFMVLLYQRGRNKSG